VILSTLLGAQHSTTPRLLSCDVIPPHSFSQHNPTAMADDEKHGSRRRDRSRDRDRERDRDKDRSHRSSHRHHHHRSSRHRSRSRDKGGKTRDKDGDRDRDRDRHHHRKKRTRRDDDGEGSGSDRHHKSRRETPPQRTKPTADVAESTEPAQPTEVSAKRDEWMVEPSADFIDYTQRGVRQPSPPAKLAVQPDYRPVIHKNELNQQLREGKSLDEYADDENALKEGEFAYTFGDSGSNWRMMKLKRCYEAAKESGVDLEAVALERYGDLRLLDDAREEEMELGRREMYGADRRDAKAKPTGELWRERLARRQVVEAKLEERAAREQARILNTAPPPPQPAASTASKAVDQTTLNRMRAALMKAQLRGDPKAAKMEEEYNVAVEAALSAPPPKTDGVVVLSAMDTRQIAGLGGRVGREVVMGKKGKVVENQDMTLDDMLREEKITRGQGAGRQMAERISRDAKFDVRTLTFRRPHSF